MFNIGSIFEPNNHSNWLIKYKSVSSGLGSKISDLVLSNYSNFVKEIESVEQFDGTEINSNNFKVVFSDISSQRNQVLVRMHKAFDEQFINAVHEVMLLLAEGGCPVSSVFPNDNGDYVTRYGSEIFSLYKFMSGGHFRGSIEEICSTARGLAKFDKVLSVLPESSRLIVLRKESFIVDDRYTFSEDVWRDIFARASSRKLSGINDDFDIIILDYSQYILESVERCGHELVLPSQLVHSDLHPHNLITDGSSLLAIIDLDSINFWERMRAVSFALHRLIRQYLVNTPGESQSREKVLSIKDLFLDNYCGINSLSHLELANVGRLIEHEALRRATYIAKDFYYRDSTAWKLGINKQLLSLFEAQYFE